MSDDRLARIETKLDHIGETVGRNNMLLTGNGEPSKGLAIRVDRLEQDRKRGRWWSRTWIGVAFVALGAWGSELIR